MNATRLLASRAISRPVGGRRPVAGLLGSAVLALTLAGCGGGSADATDGTASPDGAGSSAPVDEATQEIRDLLPAEVVEAGTLTVASDVPYPPFEFFGSDGETIIGADPDLGAALGEVLGLEFAFEVSSFDSIIPGLKSGRTDIAMSGMADNAEREEQVTFVNYMTNGGAVLARSDADLTLESVTDLCGTAVGVQSATVMADVLESTNADACEEKMDISQFQKQTDAVSALDSGRVESVVITTGSAGYLIETTGDKFTTLLTVPGGPLGIAVPKDEPELAEAIQAALQKLMDDGTYTEILSTYGLDAENAIAEATINAGAES